MWPIIESLSAYSALLQLIGVVGFLGYIGGFALLQINAISSDGMAFSIINIFAAFCVLISLIGAFNLASLLIQLSYIVIGLAGIIVRLRTDLFIPRDPVSDFLG